jgi:NAD(P)-dependent dehydrogenase (short-subunit alcohol dehydrogenase family)
VNVVVGAASGMGEAVATALAPRGEVLLADRDGDAAEALARRLGSHVSWTTCDMTLDGDRRELAARLDHLDALVVTAGLSPSMGRGMRIFEVNLLGTASLLRALDDVVGEGTTAVCFASIAGHGRDHPSEVISVLDDPLDPDFFRRLADAGVDPDDPGAAYSLSKHGVIRLASRLAPEWGRRGARIVSLSPGIVDTPMGRFEFERRPIMKEMVAASALARTGRPEEVAAVAAFLCSSGASFITGCDVLVDGGTVAALTSR